jgi:polysaccharide biosynthesis protein PslJ
MRVVDGSAERGPVVSSAVVLSALTALTMTAVAGLPMQEVTVGVAAIVTFAVGYRWLLQWRALLALTILLILFIPIRRYTLPGDMPFQLEPYRLAVGLMIVAWFASLLVDPRVRLKRSGLERPLLLLTIAVLGSVVVNGATPDSPATSSDVFKTLMFFASFFLVFYLVISVVKTREHVDFLVKLLVLGGAVLGGLAVIESRTGFNPFNQLSDYVPFLKTSFIQEIEGRVGRVRAYGPAQHPIALGAAFVMLLPLAIYLARGVGRARWWLAAAALGMGVFATLSRTSILMMVAVVLVFLMLRPKETKRLWPALIPAIVVIHFALPGHLGTLKSSFFPTGGLIAEQQSSAGSRAASGRIADLGPAFREISAQPVLGQGFGSRVESGAHANASILDNQWLDVALETGIAGLAAWLWLFIRFIRRTGREAKRDDSSRGWLLTAIVASVTGYAVGMLTFDAFAFIQVTFLLFILLGFGASLHLAREARLQASGAS